MKKFFTSPYGTMVIVLIMYLIKVSVKYVVAWNYDSTIFYGDGTHNTTDIMEALMVMLMVFLARLPESARFPYKLVNVESLFGLFVGIGLWGTAVLIFFESMSVLSQVFYNGIGLRTQEPYIPLKVEGAYVLVGCSVMVASWAISRLVGQYQVNIGTTTGHSSIVDDGLETKNDSWIELSAAFGIAAQFLIGAAWIEYLVALGIALLMIRTGYEIIKKRLKILLHHSIGEECDQQIQEVIKRIPGVVGVSELKSFLMGTTVILNAKVLVSPIMQTKIQNVFKRGMAELIMHTLRICGFSDQKLMIRFDCQDPNQYRTAIALQSTKDGLRIADSLTQTTKLAICTWEHERNVRTEIVAVPESIGLVIALLRQKRVKSIVFFQPGTTEQAFAKQGIGCVSPRSPYPERIGVHLSSQITL